jgi:hypothetical protein
MSEYDNPNSVYCKSLKAVADKESKQVQKFQFQKQNKKGGQQLYKMTDVTTGIDVILSSSSKVYDKHREPEFNVWIWADTFDPVDDDDLEAAAHAVVGATVQKKGSSKQINRTLSLTQKKHILTEVVFGEQIHPRKQTRIEPFLRNVQGNTGHFYASVVAHLNASSVKEGPFHLAPATVDKIKDFIDIGVIDRMKFLKENYGEKFMERKDWDTFSDRPTDKDAEETRDTILQDEINSMFDALVYGAHEPPKESSSGYTGSDDEELAKVVNDGKTLKRKREHKLEPVKPKSTNSVVQFDQRTSAIGDMMKSLTALMGQPESASIAPTGRPSASSSDFDPEMRPLLQSLLALPKPPGTTAICESLAMGLGKYGIISLSELHEMVPADAESVLKGLHWSPMQIEKVLKPAK